MTFLKSKALAEKAHRLIPGGCHTYAKGDDQYPELAPGFIARGLGCRIWDVDGNEFIEYGMGNRCVTLGHAYAPVVAAARAELEKGANFIRPAAIEVECAEQFLRMIPGAEMVKFCKDGSTATSDALRLARAYTGRDCIAYCADHPFFATDDWFIGTTPMNAGIPAAVSDLSLKFRYNDIDSVRALFAAHPGRIAGLIMEAAKNDEPTEGFLEDARRLCHENGALFILDEMITGFRWHNGGAQSYYGVTPDLSCFGKALGNGFAVSALAGKREFMRLGGLDHERERVFLLSTTHGGETHGLAAAIATMRVYEDQPVIAHLYAQGEKLREGLRQAAVRHGVDRYVEPMGRACALVYSTRDAAGRPCQSFRSLFMQETIRRGVLAPSLIVSYSHADADIEMTIDAIDAALAVYARALGVGPERHLTGRPSQIVYRRYNQMRAAQG
jgi:glutamate-1-semialdehyde 2,1-aminomutase